MTVDSAVPYKGLAASRTPSATSRFFFGREREREVICANLMASKLTVLYGETGVGKSSVLRAGVAQTLRAREATRWTSSCSTPGRTTRRRG